MTEPRDVLTADAVKFLELLLSECRGADAHSWRKCRRCLAFDAVQRHDQLAVRLLQHALAGLSAQPERAEVGLSTGRLYLKFAGMVLAVEADPCRDPNFTDAVWTERTLRIAAQRINDPASATRAPQEPE